MHSNSPIKRFAICNPFIICICLNCIMQMRFWHPQVGAWDQGKCSKTVWEMNVELDFYSQSIQCINMDDETTNFYIGMPFSPDVVANPSHLSLYANKSIPVVPTFLQLHTPLVGWLFSWLVTHLLIWHFPDSICITAPAQSHVTKFAMCPALFQIQATFFTGISSSTFSASFTPLRG